MADFDIKDFIPADLAASIRQHGFAKLAAAHLGLPDLQDKTIYEQLGMKLAMRQLQWKRINKGLGALKKLGDE